jgi:hypothetical protein
MADPISVAVSVAGLVSATIKISTALKGFISSAVDTPSLARSVQAEVHEINVVLSQLQRFVLREKIPGTIHGSMIEVEEFLAILAGVVCTVSELERVIDNLKLGHRMGTLHRVRWAWKESAISRILQRLQAHKLSLALLMTILTRYKFQPL